LSTLKDRIYLFLRESPDKWFSDSEIRRALEIKHHSQVNSRCRQLAGEGKIIRRKIGGRLMNSYREELGEPPPEPITLSPPEEQPTEPGSISISLESDLEEFIFENLGSVEEGLKPYRGKSGRQYTVQSGRIDILATDKEDNFVVIELKADMGGDSVLTQTLAYMADVSKIAEERKVRGIIIARDFSSKLIAAVSLLQNIELMKYKVKFDFERLT